MNKTLILEPQRVKSLTEGFFAVFQTQPTRFFSAPGRTEIGGNHTDHQRGRVLAAAVNLDTVAAVRPNGTKTVRIQSQGYPMCQVDLTNLQPVEAEINSTPALVRGVAARFAQLGCNVEGFDAYVESTVLPGSGLSSSAAFEVLVGTILNHLYFDGRVSQPEIAMIGQYAENVFFGKPCGLMDQTASAVGGMVYIMTVVGGVWNHEGLSGEGWLAVALVIFCLWSPYRAIWGSILFGGLLILYLRMPIDLIPDQIYKILPYVVTIIVLVAVSMRKKRENQPPASLGNAYFREER